ncbi:MAG TPA: glutathione S-transferase family protein [Parvularculaceae bacterium]|nr:glutathione S-transferase family protein [Parvularculaceae bacterium]HRX39036.1 glutathione S-transferase family protein [Parvularculaceae bacterium]
MQNLLPLAEHRLISHHLCPYVQRAVIVLTEKDIPHERIYVDLANKPDWFIELSPLGRTPVLQAGDAVLFESQVIAEYLDEITPNSLHPTDPLEKARHRSWIEFGSETLNAIAGFYYAENEMAFEEKRQALRRKFERVEFEIEGPWFGGQRFYMIDGVWGTIFRYFDTLDTIADFGIFSNLSRVSCWRAATSKRRSIANAVPDSYPLQLKTFLKNKPSHLAKLISAGA